MNSSTVICWTGPSPIGGVSGQFYYYNALEIPVFNANSVDSDQMSSPVVSDLSLLCLPMSLYRMLGINEFRR